MAAMSLYILTRDERGSNSPQDILKFTRALASLILSHTKWPGFVIQTGKFLNRLEARNKYNMFFVFQIYFYLAIRNFSTKYY